MGAGIKIYCILCRHMQNSDLKVIDRATRDFLKVVFANLNFDADTNSLICDSCSVKLLTAFNFKSICLDTEGDIVIYTSSEDLLPVDLREVYVIMKDPSKFINELKDKHVCRLCMQLVNGGYQALDNINAEMLKRLIPNLNFSTIRDPVVCNPCIKSVTIHSNFIKYCLERQEKEESNPTSQIAGPNVHHSDLSVRVERIDFGLVKNEQSDESLMEFEEVVTRRTQNERKRIDSSQHCTPSKKIPKGAKKKNHTTNQTKARSKPSQSVLLKCEFCDYNTMKERYFNRHLKIHDTPTEVKWYISRHQSNIFVCRPCKFTSPSEKVIKNHVSVHKVPSDPLMMKCEFCQFQSVNVTYIRKHLIQHQNPKDIIWFTCTTCPYKTKFPGNLKKHSVVHKETSELEIFKCSKCLYCTKRSYQIQTHMRLVHGTNKTKWFHCEECDWKTKYGNHMKRHKLTHIPKNLVDHQGAKSQRGTTNPEGESYECYNCGRKFKTKQVLISHMIIHKDISDDKTYKCDLCQYQARRLRNFVSHQLIHKKPTDVKWHGCELCSFKTKYKSYLTYHRQTHKDVSERSKFRCKICPFETVAQFVLRNHMRKHEYPFWQQYECYHCNRRMSKKKYLVKHMELHRNANCA